MDERGFQRVVLEQGNRVYSYAAMILRDPGEAQDVVQEAMVRLWQHRETVDGDGVRGWLKRTAHNLCIDRIRRRRIQPVPVAEEDPREPVDPTPDPGRLAESEQTARGIEAALERMSPLDRSVLVLREVQQLPYAEIAEILGLPLGTLKARLHRAREQLRRRLIREGVQP